MRFGAGALLIHEGSVLLGRRSSWEVDPLTWSCFGGKSRREEDGFDCMAREVMEESGVAVDRSRARLLHTHGSFGRFEYHTFAVFLERAVQPILSDEMQEFAWFPFGEAPSCLWDRMPSPLHPGLANLVARPEVAFRLHGWMTALARPAVSAPAARPGIVRKLLDGLSAGE